jgi:muramoyltetrapeptide carboxypeptidase
MDRRDLMKALAGGVLATGALAAGSGAAQGKRAARRAALKPPRLEPGMTVGLVAPAGASSNREEVRYAGDVLRSLGYRVKEGEHVYARTQYLAGTDRQRAADVNAMFADPEVHAIFTLRGGYGTMRTLPHLDYERIAKHPKVVIGYSDISGLLFGLHARTGLVGFHGPCATSTFSEYTLAEYRKVVENPQPSTVIAAPPSVEYPPGRAERSNRITTFVGGRARGPLIGGNLSLLSPLIGSPYAPDLSGAILFLEDVNEAFYRIDRMLTHLLLAGQLERLAGIVLGKFTKIPVEGNSFNLEEITEHLLMPLGIPIVRGLMIGHIQDKATVPLGVEAELDADAGTLTLLEPAVV